MRELTDAALPLALQDKPSVGAISVSALDAAELPRHRWYFFKEAFSPDIVRVAIDDTRCTPDDLVLDPFCGSGTVPLQAGMYGCRAEGIEVNPFLAFVAKTKLQQCDPNTLNRRVEDALKAAARGRHSRLARFSTFGENHKKSKWLFNDSVLSAFEAAWNSTAADTNCATQLTRLCLIGAAMDNCNAVKDGKCLRYRADWQERKFCETDFINSVRKRCEAIAADLVASKLSSSRVRIWNGDSRVHSTATFRLCVTSPPYLNSFDYSDVYRPELFLGRWVTSMEQLRTLRQRTLRSHVQAKWKEPTDSDFGITYKQSAEAIRLNATHLWNSRIPTMIQAYFEDMRTVLSNLRMRAARNASTWIVVSTSAYGGIEIPVDLILAEVAVTCGWCLREVSVLRYLRRVACQQWNKLARMKQSGPHLRESLIILDAATDRKSRTAKSSRVDGEKGSRLENVIQQLKDRRDQLTEVIEILEPLQSRRRS